ncbi:MAG: DUF3015 family protein [Pseudomonadota bacterium]
MKNLVTLASVGALALSFTSAQAQTTMRDAPNPWLDCGIGAMIFPDDNLEVGAGISNIIWDLGTTAVISAASSPDTCNGLSNVKTALFIERTYDTLEMELAKGRGDNLAALAELVGAADQATFVAALRDEMPAIVTAPEAERREALYFAALAAAEA